MLDACLENVTSFEGLSDKNTGRIVFLNGSSSNKSNLHPAVFYGNEFKGLAYLDDIDKITNGEGSLGTRVKALEDMLGLKDVTNVIDTWNDVQEFFKNVDEGLNLMTMLDGKLDKTGGTIKGDSWLPLQIVSGNDSAAAITVSPSSRNGLQLGWSSAQGAFLLNYQNNCQIGVHPDSYPYFKTYTDSYVILHTGNVGDYALKTDGSNKMSKGVLFSDRTLTEALSTKGTGIEMFSRSEGGSLSPNGSTYFSVLHAVSSYVGLQLAVYGGSFDKSLYYRKIDEHNTWTDWKTIAFTDSDITGNAATATKLKDKVSLWGNEFDGTQNLSEDIILDHGKYIRFKKADNTAFLSVMNLTDNYFTLGQDAAGAGCGTYLYGRSIYFKTGESLATAMTITEEGNIEIAGANNVYTRKLAVGIGSTHIISTTTGVPALGTPAANSLLVGSVHYGLQIGTDTNSEASFIQAQRFDSADAKTLNLNPRGGEVNVGGNVRIANDYGLLSTTTSGSVVQMVGITKNNALFVGTDACIVNKMLTSVYGSLINFYTGATLETRTKTMTLTSSGHVLIGEAADDGESALQVKGDIRLGAVTAIGTYISSESNGYLGLLSTGNEMIIEGKTNSDININYRRSKRGYAPKTWNWLAGSSTEYADFALGHATFNGGALIPTGQKLTFGDANGDHATIEYDSIAKAIKVDGNLFTTGTNASGGKADAQQGGTGGNAEVHEYEFLAGQSTYTELNPKGSRNVIVQIYEWNANDNTWDMILTDVSVTNENIIVTFGRDTTVKHLMTVV
jgi:hypothetical protein